VWVRRKSTSTQLDNALLIVWCSGNPLDEKWWIFFGGCQFHLLRLDFDKDKGNHILGIFHQKTWLGSSGQPNSSHNIFSFALSLSPFFFFISLFLNDGGVARFCWGCRWGEQVNADQYNADTAQRHENLVCVGANKGHPSWATGRRHGCQGQHASKNKGNTSDYAHTKPSWAMTAVVRRWRSVW
jgi:hypothetical protein